MLAVVAVVAIAAVLACWLRVGIKHRLLLGCQLHVEALHRLSPLDHPGATLLRHRQHLVETLRCRQLGKFVTLGLSRLSVDAFLLHARLASLGKSVPGSFLRRGQLQAFLQSSQMFGTMFAALGLQ